MKTSIIVTNLNYGRFLGDCLESIAAQSHPDIEVIFIDAGSTDNSWEVAERFRSRPGWQFHLNAGQRQYDAYIWGLTRATGEIQGWLNSDDIYISRLALERAAAAFQECPSIDVVSLGGYYIAGDGRWLRPVALMSHPLLRQTDAGYCYGFCQPATFWRKKVFDTLGLRNDLGFCGDSHFLVRASREFNLLLDQTQHIAGYRLHGTNLSVGVKAVRIRELARLNDLLFPNGVRGFYLRGVAALVQCLEKLPQDLSEPARKFVYYLNNLLSYLTVYRIPPI